MFRGTIINRLDSKGRLSVPARFRAVLEADSLNAVYCCKSLTHPVLEAGGKRLMEEVDRMLGQLDLYAKERHDLAHTLIGESDALPIDKEGRIILPDSFRAFAKLKDEAAFVGIGLRFEIWSPKELEKHIAASRTRAKAFLQKQGRKK
jgi:MraZ protein